MPRQPAENRDQECKSVFGESDMLSMIEDRNDSEKEQSEAEAKNKSTKRCFNRKCESTRDIKKLKSRVIPAKFRNFCRSCYQNYVSNQFCEFCEQVYDNSAFNEEDDNNWMGCDSCDRWVLWLRFRTTCSASQRKGTGTPTKSSRRTTPTFARSARTKRAAGTRPRRKCTPSKRIIIYTRNHRPSAAGLPGRCTPRRRARSTATPTPTP